MLVKRTWNLTYTPLLYTPYSHGAWVQGEFFFINPCINALWLCAAIERVLDQSSLNMEIIVNNKSLANGLNLIQLETAVGAAMKSFEGGLGKWSKWVDISGDKTVISCFTCPSCWYCSRLVFRRYSVQILVSYRLYWLRTFVVFCSPSRWMPFSVRHILILSSHICPGLRSGIFHSWLPTTDFIHVLFFHYVTCTVCPILDLITVTVFSWSSSINVLSAKCACCIFHLPLFMCVVRLKLVLQVSVFREGGFFQLRRHLIYCW